MPLRASARGQRSLGNSLEDIAFAALEYPQDIFVNIHVSWLDPKKVRQITLVGEKKMVTWDDLDTVGPIKVYDKHVEKTSIFYKTYGEFQLLSKDGNITIPKIVCEEPLKIQAQYFVDCITQNVNPSLADAQKAFEVVRTLCGIEKSMKKNGARVSI